MQPLSKLKLITENRPYRLDNKSLQLTVPKVLTRLCLQPGSPAVPSRVMPACPLTTAHGDTAGGGNGPSGPTGCYWHQAWGSFVVRTPLTLDFFFQAAIFGSGSCRASSFALNDLFPSYLCATSQLWTQFSCLWSTMGNMAFPLSLKSVFKLLMESVLILSSVIPKPCKVSFWL